MAFSDNFRYYLQSKKMTQMALAKKLKRRHSTVFRWLSGETFSRLPTVILVAEALGVAVRDPIDDRRFQADPRRARGNSQ